MKKIIMILMISVGVTTTAFGQKMMAGTKTETDIIASEKAVWNALLSGRLDDFANMLTEEFLDISAGGVKN